MRSSATLSLPKGQMSRDRVSPAGRFPVSIRTLRAAHSSRASSDISLASARLKGGATSSCVNIQPRRRCIYLQLFGVRHYGALNGSRFSLRGGAAISDFHPQHRVTVAGRRFAAVPTGTAQGCGLEPIHVIRGAAISAFTRDHDAMARDWNPYSAASSHRHRGYVGFRIAASRRSE